MTPENFCYWLQGIFEIQMAGVDSNEKRVPKLSESQIEMIQRHLQYVFAPKIEGPKSLSQSLIDSISSETKIC